MGFNHQSITSAQLYAKSSRVQAWAEEARKAGWAHWVDDIPVSPHCHEFATALREAVPSVKFYPAAMYRVVDFQQATATVFVALWVGLECCPYALVQIGRADYRKSGNTYLYGVMGRKIRNKKYKFYDAQHYMALTENLKKAVRTAVSHLIAYSPHEVADIQFEDFKEDVRAVSHSKRSRLSDLLDSIGKEVLANEIRAAKAAGYAFSTPEFQAVAAEIDEATAVSSAERMRRVSATFVHFYKVGGEMFAGTVECIDVGNRNTIDGKTEKTCKIDELPGYIQERVPVLQTLEPGNYVAGVGRKMSDMMYWVEK